MKNLKVLNVIVTGLTIVSYLAQGGLMIFGRKQAQLAADAEKAAWMKEVLDKVNKK
mgnify:CR=1 FL=1